MEDSRELCEPTNMNLPDERHPPACANNARV